MKITSIILLFICLTFSFAFAVKQENCKDPKNPQTAVCTKEKVKEEVEKMCEFIESAANKDAVIKKVQTTRYNCCGERNYIWINTFDNSKAPKPIMIIHPIKPALNGDDLSDNVDADGVPLFVKMVNALKTKPAGDWVEYKWEKAGAKEGTSKISWVKLCTLKGTKDPWVVGSGTWKE